jgi:anionic cell wall polymer biosynthesis LytR-Cps2A-Psr (LCP) family protein
MKKAVWILAILTALVCAFSVVNVMISGKALEGVQRYMVSIGELNESLKEIQETSAELKQMIEELSGAEEEVEQGEPGDISNGKI